MKVAALPSLAILRHIYRSCSLFRFETYAALGRQLIIHLEIYWLHEIRDKLREVSMRPGNAIEMISHILGRPFFAGSDVSNKGTSLSSQAGIQCKVPNQNQGLSLASLYPYVPQCFSLLFSYFSSGN